MFKNTTSMANHLNRIHNVLLKEAAENVKLHQLESVELIKNIYEQLIAELNKYLALALATSSAPYSLVRNLNFVKFIKLLNQNYKLPSDVTIAKDVDRNFADLLSGIKICE